MADTGDSKSLAGNRVGVRIPSPAQGQATQEKGAGLPAPTLFGIARDDGD